MSYRTILVYLDNRQSAEALLSVATKLAEQHSAHLIGTYIVPPLQVYATAEIPVPVELTQSHLSYYNKIADSIASAFDSATSNQNFASEWRKILPTTFSSADALVEMAQAADLIVMEHKGQKTEDDSVEDITERMLLSSHRPIVLVPTGVEHKSIGQKVFVAWNGSGQATRAVHDALPALKEAETVILHTINPPSFDRHRVRGSAADLANCLSRHDVSITISQSVAAGHEIGDELILTARDNDADLLVMGAYGHSRLRESLFGGASKTVLKKMNIPVLMSHG